MDSPPDSPQVSDTSLTAADDALDAIGAPLFQDRSFWGLTATQFLGAFNDNLFKQLVLLLAVGGAAAAAGGNAAGGNVAGQARGGPDLQSLAMFCFALPFLLFSGFAGYLSERYSKRRVVVTCKVAEI